jgi:isopenicillin N synthase-like dioxygenase
MSSVPTRELPPPTPAVARAIETCRELPLLDIGDFLSGKPGALEQLAADIRAIHRSLGFMAMVNHGIDQAIIDEAVEQARQAFALPRDELEKYRKQDHMQGYWPADSVRNIRPGYEAEKQTESTMSGWVILRDREPGDSKVVKNLRHRAMNKWPDPQRLPKFRAAINRYHQAMLALGMKLLKPYALALGQEPAYFDKDFVDPEWYGRLNHYSARPNRENEFGVTAHSDHSFITLLPMSPIPGLQVRTPQMDWLDVSYVPGAIIVNGGEWLNQVSNGRFMATPHRVTQPTCERITLPFFFDPGDHAVNDPVPGILESGEERKVARKTFHEHFAGYIDAYTKAKDAKSAT